MSTVLTEKAIGGMGALQSPRRRITEMAPSTIPVRKRRPTTNISTAKRPNDVSTRRGTGSERLMYYLVETNKSFVQASADLESAVQRHGFGVLHVHDLGTALRGKGVRL